MESIKQKPLSSLLRGRLPDFHNLGVLLRVLLLVNVLALATALIRYEQQPLNDALLNMAGQLEPPLLATLLVLYVINPFFQRHSYAVNVIVVLIVTQLVITLPFALSNEEVLLWRWRLWAFVATLLSLTYFDYRNLRLSPALSEARVQALTSRIRPHFLFNALNGILGVIRSDPRRAERALEELADLFRAFMRNNRELVPLAEELALCERYVDLETLRLGDRLSVHWSISAAAPYDALVPPLLLQPLIENAIYHGIEPAAEGGEITVHTALLSRQLFIKVENPIIAEKKTRKGNHMALDNIRERLMLFFDLEAQLEVSERDGRYRVSVRLPYRKRKKKTS